VATITRRIPTIIPIISRAVNPTSLFLGFVGITISAVLFTALLDEDGGFTLDELLEGYPPLEEEEDEGLALLELLLLSLLLLLLPLLLLLD